MTGNRVGSTDYFAALDEVAGGGSAPDVRPVQSGPAPAARLRSVDPEGTRQTFPAAPAPRDAGVFRPDVPAQERIDTTSSDAVTRAVTLQQDGPDEAAYQDAGDGCDIAPTSVAPSVSIDLEKNLTAELEDELIGAFRQSFDAVSGSAELSTPQEDFSPAAPTDHRPVAPGVAVSDRGQARDGLQITPTYETNVSYGATPGAADERPSQPVMQTAGREPRPSPSADSGYSVPGIGSEPYRRQEPGFRTSDAPTHAAPANDSKPTIDEDDLFATLSASAPTAEPQAVRGSDSDTNFDALFADLNLAARHPSARSEPSFPQQALEPEPVAAEDIDDMAWPAAASAVPPSNDDELPPPPEGYDLDAVARAMHESDPTLRGSGVLPPHSASEKAAAAPEETRSRRGLFAAVAVLAIAVVGGGAFFLFDGDAVPVPDGPPPVIAGLQGPLKVYPDDQPAPETDQGAKLIYDRVGGTSDPSRERLVLPENPEPAQLPPAPETALGTDPLVPGAPKRVRTLVVRPDGTIIPDADEPAAQPEPTRVVSTPIVPEPSAPEPQITTPVAETAPAPEPAQPETPAIVSTAVPEEAAGQPELPLQPANVPTVTPRKKPDVPVQVSRAPAPAVAVTPAPANPDGPLDLTNPAPAPARTTPVAAAPASTSGQIPSGTYIVQVTSQRSADAARDAYSGLQRRYPSVLGNRSAVIVSADLGDRGTFYRARIPTGSRNDAISLCESLKAVGGDCFVRQN